MKKRNLIIASMLVGSLGIAGIGVAHACAEHSGGGHSVGGKGPRGDRMMHAMKNLDLTQEQRDAVRAIHDESRDKMEERRDEMSSIREALKAEARATTFNASKVRELADAKSTIMADITVEQVQRTHQVRQQLTAEQLEKFDAIKERRSDRKKH